MKVESSDRHALDVWLGDVPVGRLALLADGRCTFRFFTAYDERYPRPVLGQAFEEDRSAGYEARGRLPAFFQNLLPEGPLRQLILGPDVKREPHAIYLLERVGEDLPGAVRVSSAEGPEPSTPRTVVSGSEPRARGARPRFSLAGLQLKFSVIRTDKGALTVPVSGVGGDWIVKLPDPAFKDVPVNEHAMMTWAKLAGLDVPEIGLVPCGSVDGIDLRFFERGEDAFMIRRFDREGAGRIHIEDFAQVLGVYPDDKYDGYSYERLAAMVARVCGEDDLFEYARRLVFALAIGNTDGHLKNWSLRYPDGVTARLAPVYDFVCVLPYLGEVEFALKLAGSRKWKDVRMASFEVLGDVCGVPRGEIRGLVEETLDRVVAAAGPARERARWSAEGWEKIAEHWRRVPLLKGRSF